MTIWVFTKAEERNVMTQHEQQADMRRVMLSGSLFS